MKTLRGNRILISKPAVKELRKSWSSLDVYAVGESVKDISAGDKVYVRATALELSEKIEVDGEMKFMIHEQDIAIIW
jgi:hypothetical protein